MPCSACGLGRRDRATSSHTKSLCGGERGGGREGVGGVGGERGGGGSEGGGRKDGEEGRSD